MISSEEGEVGSSVHEVAPSTNQSYTDQLCVCTQGENGDKLK